MIDQTSVDLLALIGPATSLKRQASTNGGEWAGPCPRPLCGDRDCFRVWPHPAKGNPRFWCRKCGFNGDPIAWLREMEGLTFPQALARLGLQSESTWKGASDSLPWQPFQVRMEAQPTPRPDKLSTKPTLASEDPAWQEAAWQFMVHASEIMWSPQGEPGRDYLAGRGFTEDTIIGARLGYNPVSHKEHWGETEVYVPQGIVIPWVSQGQIRKINFRCLDGGDRRYIQAAGGMNCLYGTDLIVPGCTVVMVEGEFNALSIIQSADDLVVAIAVGSCTAARKANPIGQLAVADQILLAFDNDEAGNKAAEYWASLYPKKSYRLLPTRKDVNDMLQAGEDIWAWIAGGLGIKAPADMG